MTRDGRSKKYAYKGIREHNTAHIYVVHPYYFLGISVKCSRDVLCTLLSLLPLYAYFFDLPSFNFLILVMLLHVCICTFYSKDDHGMDEIDTLETIPESTLIPQGM